MPQSQVRLGVCRIQADGGSEVFLRLRELVLGTEGGRESGVGFR